MSGSHEIRTPAVRQIVRSVRGAEDAVRLIEEARGAGETGVEIPDLLERAHAVEVEFDEGGATYRMLPTDADLTVRGDATAAADNAILTRPWGTPCIVDLYRALPATRINVIIALKNRGENLKNTLASFAKAASKHRERFDDPTRVIVTDYGSTDVDVLDALESCAIDHVLIVEGGEFSKAGGQQKGFETIADTSEIAVFYDADVLVPKNFFQVVRESVVPGRQFFVPVLWGATNEEGWGMGFGTLAVAAGDFARVGGYGVYVDSKAYGGEDTEPVVGLLRDGLRMKRFMWDGLYHQDHEKTSSFYTASNRSVRVRNEENRAYMRCEHDGDDDVVFCDEEGRRFVFDAIVSALGSARVLLEHDDRDAVSFVLDGGPHDASEHRSVRIGSVERFVHPLIGHHYVALIELTEDALDEDSSAGTCLMLEIARPLDPPLIDVAGFPQSPLDLIEKLRRLERT